MCENSWYYKKVTYFNIRVFESAQESSCSGCKLSEIFT